MWDLMFYISALPEGCKPLFLSSKTQEIFSCMGDEDVTDQNPYKLIPVADIKQDFFNRAAISDFNPFKQMVTVRHGSGESFNCGLI